MILGALAGLLVAVAIALVTGKLQLTKSRIVYGTHARVTVAAGLVPIAALVVYLVATGHTINKPGGMGLFVAAIAASVALMYGIGWPLGEDSRP